MIASTTGMSEAWMAARLREVAAVDGGDHRGVLLARDVPDDGDDAGRAEREQRAG